MTAKLELDELKGSQADGVMGLPPREDAPASHEKLARMHEAPAAVAPEDATDDAGLSENPA